MTNWFHGHATISGIEPGVWFDFRHSPFGLSLPTGSTRVEHLVSGVREAGGFLSAAHPLVPAMGWQFLAEAYVNEAARTDALEVWNGRWQASDEAALQVWHRLLCQGWDVVANGGSDLHGSVNDDGLTPGTPTTVVHASALARPDIVAALRAGRSFITRHPRGVEVYLTASGPAGQHTYTGGQVFAEVGDPVDVRVCVRGAGGMTLSLHGRDGRSAQVRLTSDDQVVEQPIVMGRRSGFVRAEVRGPASEQGRWPWPTLRMEALTNAIRLVCGPVPQGTVPEHAPPPARIS
jgi:hypothetical protein